MNTALKSIFLGLTLLSTTAFAFSPSQVPTSLDARIPSIRESIAANLADGNIGVRTSTIQLVMELKDTYPDRSFDFAIIPLMNVLKSDEVPELRMQAACALNSYDSELARFAVSRRALYDSNDRVAKLCNAITREWSTHSAD